ncbi:SecD/SecF fusion protein [Amphibacillus marinus]|uniref:Multifunctional fusion protein n=1 Tax=Amphibacillus marinus TaxID=872970 RepID=A0A1H8NZB7_9BACI|nr:protein translocase subunit SecD [Amphibacillus marinus]SEO34947.1 SecD/SecF fusion protein [Amphibacillus marinus]
MVKKSRLISFFIILLTLGVVLATTSLDVARDLRLGLDLQGGVEILYEVEPLNEEQEINATVLEATVQSLRQRVDVLGVSEPNFSIEEPNRIRVQLAGITNEEEARELLSTSAILSFRDVEDREYLSGSDLVEGGARQDFNPTTNQPIVSVQLQDGTKMGEATQTIMANPDITNQLVIWLDYEEGDAYYDEMMEAEPKFISAPVIEQVLDSSTIMITGNFTVQSAQQLADILNAGSLPVSLNEEYSTSVSAQFGIEAMNETIFAGVLGILSIFLFMVVYYRFLGVISVITLSLYIYLVMLVFGWMNGVLTLPGIAALILGVGMAVDANIISFERMTEELKLGKTVKAAFDAANKNSLSTIVDANITTLIAAAVLFILGTSSVRGFATLLIVSIVLSFFTTVFMSRLLLGLWVRSNILTKRYRWFGIKEAQVMDLVEARAVKFVEPKWKFDFVKYRKPFFIISSLLTIMGILSIIVLGLNLSIDFTSGSRIEVNTIEQTSEEDITSMFAQLGVEPHTLSYSGVNNEVAVVRFNEQLDQATITEVRDYFEDQYGTEVSASTVSPVVGQELARNALLAVLYASIFMIIYITIRFEFYFAVTATIAMLHDAFFIIVLFSMTQMEFDTTIIAAVLTIVGYSMNDTIVTFDRIRENLKMAKRVRSFSKLANIVNNSLRQTFTRSINTGITIVVAAILLYFFGASAISNFSFALVIGLIAGMYSSMFIAAQLWLVWRGRTIKEKPIVYVERKRNDSPQV